MKKIYNPVTHKYYIVKERLERGKTAKIEGLYNRKKVKGGKYEKDKV